MSPNIVPPGNSGFGPNFGASTSTTTTTTRSSVNKGTPPPPPPAHNSERDAEVMFLYAAPKTSVPCFITGIADDAPSPPEPIPGSSEDFLDVSQNSSPISQEDMSPGTINSEDSDDLLLKGDEEVPEEEHEIIILSDDDDEVS